MSKHDQYQEARTALESGVAAVEKIIRDRDVETQIAELRKDRLLGLLGRVEQAREFLKSALAESDADETEGGAGWDVEVDARTVLALLDDAAPECPQPCGHLSAEDAREGHTCPEHPCTCPPATPVETREEQHR